MKYLKYLFSLGLILILQTVKWWVINYHSLFVFINHNFIFGYIRSLDIVLSVVIILLLFFVLLTIKKTDAYALILMLSGAVSNLADRITSGGVVDYFQLGFLRFNLADILLIFGVIIYGWQATVKNKN